MSSTPSGVDTKVLKIDNNVLHERESTSDEFIKRKMGCGKKKSWPQPRRRGQRHSETAEDSEDVRPHPDIPGRRPHMIFRPSGRVAAASRLLASCWALAETIQTTYVGLLEKN